MRQFFGACFHEDWDLEAPNADGVVDLFIADHPSQEELAALAALVDAYVGSPVDDSQMERDLCAELGCYFTPSASGMRARDWLQHVSAKLRAAVVRDGT